MRKECRGKYLSIKEQSKKRWYISEIICTSIQKDDL